MKVEVRVLEFAEDLTWLGQRVSVSEHTLGEVGNVLPTFTQDSFGTGANKNEYMKTIYREPIGKDERRIPVAAVSTNMYALIQYQNALEWIRQGLKKANVHSDELPGILRQSEYNERMHLSLRIPEIFFDPGDSF